MLLLDLNDDVLLALMEFLPNKTLLDFVLSCHTLFALARPLIKHRKYTRLYRCLCLADTWYHGADFRHAIEVIHNIRQDPTIVKYIDEIQFAALPPEQWNIPVEITDTQRTMLRECDYLEDELSRLTFVSETERELWKQAVRDLHQHACFVLLLSLCVHATSLVLSDVNELPRYLNKAVDHMYLNETQDTARALEEDHQKHDSTSSNPTRIFPKLTGLQLWHHDTEGGIYLNQDFTMLTIPTLKTLHFHMMGLESGDEDWTWRPKLGRSCTIEQVTAWKCSVKTQALADFIACMPAMKKLDYNDKFELSIGDDWDGPEDYLQLFRGFADETIESRGWEVVLPDDRTVIVREKGGV